MKSRRLSSPLMNFCVSDWTGSRLTILLFLLYPGGYHATAGTGVRKPCAPRRAPREVL
jgi:hypothetical protein